MVVVHSLTLPTYHAAHVMLGTHPLTYNKQDVNLIWRGNCTRIDTRSVL